MSSLTEPDEHFCGTCGSRVIDMGMAFQKERHPCPMGCEETK